MKNLNGLKLTKACGSALLLTIMLFNDCAAQEPANPAFSQKVFASLPVNLPQPATPQRYHITTDYFNYTLQGVFIDKIRVSGDFTTNLPDRQEKWNHVSVAKSQQPDGIYGDGEPQPFMENFTYVPSEKILQPEFFKTFPFEAVQVKNLVWDMAGMEAFAWEHLDALQLNKLYNAKNMNGPASLAGLGTFTNKDIQLKWNGITQMDNQFCAIIEFRAMDNPLACDIKMGDKNFNLKGTSHYWGSVYISLKEKRIDYAEMHEVVIMEMKWSDQPASQYVYTTRVMKVEKIN